MHSNLPALLVIPSLCLPTVLPAHCPHCRTQLKSKIARQQAAREQRQRKKNLTKCAVA